MKKNSKVEVQEWTTLFFSFDNCDIFKHVTHVRSLHRSSFYHVITSFLVEIFTFVDVPTAAIWQHVDKGDFRNFIHKSNFEVMNFVNSVYIRATLRI